MFKLQKLWHSLLCPLGKHDWSDWQPCEDLFNKWRACPWCHSEERGRAYLGKLHDLMCSPLVEQPDTQQLQEFMDSIDEIAIAAIKTRPPQEE